MIGLRFPAGSPRPAPPCPVAALETRVRRARAIRIVLAVVFAVIWVPVAVVMLVAGMSDRRA